MTYTPPPMPHDPETGSDEAFSGQDEHYKRAMNAILQAAARGWRNRVARGSAPAPRNKAVDPEADVLELRPDLKSALKDAARLDWIERHATARKIELARSLYGTGYEIGTWHPRADANVYNGSLREAIDAAMAKEAK